MQTDQGDDGPEIWRPLACALPAHHIAKVFFPRQLPAPLTLSVTPAQVVAGEGYGFSVQYEKTNLCYVFFGGTGQRIAILAFKSCIV